MRRALGVFVLGALALAGCTGSRHAGAPAAAASRLAAPAGVGDVRLDTPPQRGAGQAPTFGWEPVGGAARYQLFVRDAHGVALWAWQGADTSVRIGGLSVARPSGTGGPQLVPGSSWFVIALDGAGKVLAVSQIRQVNP
jgi:hypothetical protein